MQRSLILKGNKQHDQISFLKDLPGSNSVGVGFHGNRTVARRLGRGEFPSGPVVRTRRGLIPAGGTKIPHATRCGKKKKKTRKKRVVTVQPGVGGGH